MSGINSLDLIEFVTKAVSDVFDTIPSITTGKEFKIEPQGGTAAKNLALATTSTLLEWKFS